MYGQKERMKFVRLRAEGLSLDGIAKKLHIAKATCVAWDGEMKDAVASLRSERMDELHQTYQMGKEARIRRFGSTLEDIDKALASADWSQVSLVRLLEVKLKYLAALREEFSGGAEPFALSGRLDAGEVVAALGDLLNRVRAGDVTTEQAAKENAVLTSLLKAYEQTVLKSKLDALEAVLDARRM